jgi:hypothetical protein
MHQQRLSDGGTGLSKGQFRDGAFEFEGAGAHSDGPAGDQKRLASLAVKPGDLGGDISNIIGVNAAVPAEGGGSDFDNDSFDAAYITHFFNRTLQNDNYLTGFPPSRERHWIPAFAGMRIRIKHAIVLKEVCG